jgi:hypothetical protein
LDNIAGPKRMSATFVGDLRYGIYRLRLILRYDTFRESYISSGVAA